jgi:tetratricopeptide (TPR) repeat protein
LAIGIQHHQAGRLSAAEQVYRQILAAEPNHADATHLLGVIALQTGRHELAVEQISRAIALQGGAAAFHNNLGEAHRALGRTAEAVQCYRRALELKPDFIDALNNLGIACKTQGKLDEAIACYRRALELRPDYASAENNLGNALTEQGKLDEAVACYRRALRLKPDYADAQVNLRSALEQQGEAQFRQGDACLERGDLDRAVACYRLALDLHPALAEAHNNLGVALNRQAKPEEALGCFRRALGLKPDYADAEGNLGMTLKDLGELDEAVACCRRAVELRPDVALAHNNLGVALTAQRNPEEAAACFRRALEIKPDFLDARNNLGVALKDQGKFDEAIACYQAALGQDPAYAQAQYNLANALCEQGRRDEAAACCRRALELVPDLAEAHVQLSLLALLTGDFALGWAEYPWRWKTKQCQPRDFAQPPWDGRPLEGKTILLHAEQGLGDAIQFVRYAPLVKARGATVIVECPGPLMSLLASCPGVARVVGRGDRLPPFDVQASLLSLPGIFHTSLEDIPAIVPYLFAEPGLVERWREEWGAGGWKIGLAWRGNPNHANDRARSFPLAFLQPLAGLPDVRLFSLQKGAGVVELQQAAGRFSVTELGSRLSNFMDTAAVTKSLDLVIACDTAMAHLAGALGVPVWVALPFHPDWRWLLDRADSPWYPTARLFRQPRPGDWGSVFREMEAQLRLCCQAENPKSP